MAAPTKKIDWVKGPFHESWQTQSIWNIVQFLDIVTKPMFMYIHPSQLFQRVLWYCTPNRKDMGPCPGIFHQPEAENYMFRLERLTDLEYFIYIQELICDAGNSFDPPSLLVWPTWFHCQAIHSGAGACTILRLACTSQRPVP